MKKAFTLTEVLISVALLSIILIFLMRLLDNTKKTETVFKKQVENITKYDNIKEFISKDFLYAKSINLKKTKDGDHILQLETSNVYYDITNKYVTYLVSNNNSLYRVESKKQINKKNTNISFLENTNISKLIDDIEYFRVSKIEKTKAYFVYIKSKQKELMFTTVSIL